MQHLIFLSILHKITTNYYNSHVHNLTQNYTTTQWPKTSTNIIVLPKQGWKLTKKTQLTRVNQETLRVFLQRNHFSHMTNSLLGKAINLSVKFSINMVQKESLKMTYHHLELTQLMTQIHRLDRVCIFFPVYNDFGVPHH